MLYRHRRRRTRVAWRCYRTARGHAGVGVDRTPCGWTVRLGRAVWTTDPAVGTTDPTVPTNPTQPNPGGSTVPDDPYRQLTCKICGKTIPCGGDH